MFIPRLIALLFSGGLMLISVGVACGQDYPSRTIRIITAAAGGGSDFTARQVAQGISGPLGQPVIVENRGSGMLQYEYLSNTPPDGYGLLVSGGAFWILPLLRKVPYDVVADFAPISMLERTVFVVVVHPSVPVKSLKELIALAKARPGELNYSLGATGGPAHLGAELFKSMGGVNLVGVSYKGSAPATAAVISGEVHLTIYDAGLVGPHVKSGKLRALAVTSAEPSALAPGLTTVAAAGLPGYELVGATGLFAPGKTPAAIVNRLNQEIVRALTRPEVKERFFATGVEVVASSPEQFAATIKSDIAKWGKLIKDTGIKVE